MSDPSAPPTYEEASTAYSNPADVTIKQPSGYERNKISPLPTSSLTPGGLRLDKARKIGDRLIIDFEKVSCCPWELEGLPDGCREYIPEELRVKGISPHQWAEWCDELMVVQKKAPSIGGCLCIFCFPGFLVQSTLCAIFCPTSGDHCFKWLPCCYGDWYCGLKKWQNKVNSVLNPLDMHCKLKTYKPHQK